MHRRAAMMAMVVAVILAIGAIVVVGYTVARASVVMLEIATK